MSAIFRDALLARRERFNALFAEARHYQPQLDGAAFGCVLIDSVAPLVEAAAAAGADAGEVSDGLYTVALELYGHGMLGPERNDPWVTAGWTAMTGLAGPLGRAPRRVAAAVSNALRNLGQTSGARPAEWIAGLRACAEIMDEPETLLRAGQALAWRCGMAHYRPDALAILAALPAELAARVLGLRDPVRVPEALGRMAVDPWHDPGQPAHPARLTRVARVGGFRGFGGVFLAPPAVTLLDGELHARDGNSEGGIWRVCADAFGATFHRTVIDKWTEAGTRGSPFKLVKGRVSKVGASEADFPDLAVVTSVAANATTLAATTPLSHYIWLVGAG